jgi:ectoine hydroxylase-related dioxygenase (phytanoyl-CoA dioxygenase family)
VAHRGSVAAVSHTTDGNRRRSRLATSGPRALPHRRERNGEVTESQLGYWNEAGAKQRWVWHQDTALPLRERVERDDWGPWSTKAGILYAHAPAWALEQVVALRVSLDDSTLTNGPLRVLPGTHRGGVYTDEQIERLARANVPVDCVARSGGVVAMRPLTIHASSKSSDAQSRRVLHIEYAATVSLAPGLELTVA